MTVAEALAWTGVLIAVPAFIALIVIYVHEYNGKRAHTLYTLLGLAAAACFALWLAAIWLDVK